jgi:3-hydroxybutyryl-CoA dehydratase
MANTSMLITQDRIDAYARAVQDFNPIHVDEEFAVATDYGGTIAHGTISAALLMRFALRDLGETRPLGSLIVKYVTPAMVGDRLSCEAVGGVGEEDDSGEVVYRLRCVKGDGSVVTVGRAAFIGVVRP